MLHTLRLFLLGVHFLAAGAINFFIVLRRPFDPDNTRLCGRVYSLPALRFLGFQAELQVEELKKLTSPCVIVVNHQSNFDLFILGSVVPRRTVTIGKTSLRWIPLFGQIYWLAGNVLIERGNAAKAKAAMLRPPTRCNTRTRPSGSLLRAQSTLAKVCCRKRKTRSRWPLRPACLSCQFAAATTNARCG